MDALLPHEILGDVAADEYDREVELIEPVTLAPDSVVSGARLHLYDQCQAVRAALRRDGEVLRSRTRLAAAVDSPTATMCGWCLRKWRAANGLPNRYGGEAPAWSRGFHWTREY